MRILLQFPEGLKQKALEHAKKLEKDGNEVFISASPTFGACDLALDEARDLKAEKLVHFGHAEFHHVDFNVEYVNYEIDAPLNLLPESLDRLREYVRIGIITTIQHIHQLEAVKKFYEDNGKKVIVGKPYGFAKMQGQILGCDIGSAATIDSKVDAFVYFGGGIFHPLGAVLATTKPFFVIEPFQGVIERFDSYRELYGKKRRAKILGSVDAKRIGILLTTKNGQHNMALATILKKRIEKAGMSAGILVANTFDFDSLNNMMEFDAFVNTACPRISIDDIDRTRKPLLSANELMEVIKIKEELGRIKA
ncbi:MAG: diphthamide biosynthesis enzyme Dph2 [Candidatus Marsarchaeota archaeon]|jgi:2-(3-amino-3-carboxypropyl)histidine synthase|nr:diphthamide biosynthesis enzyme Dph2 [Candidatus Marsarchaeota archaeon]